MTATGQTSTDYQMYAFTWDVSGNVILYINGISVGTPQAIANTLAGNLALTDVVIGSTNTTPANVWDGEISHPQLLTEVLSATELLQIARRGGTA